jgi:hypothetical protein
VVNWQKYWGVLGKINMVSATGDLAIKAFQKDYEEHWGFSQRGSAD